MKTGLRWGRCFYGPRHAKVTSDPLTTCPARRSLGSRDRFSPSGNHACDSPGATPSRAGRPPGEGAQQLLEQRNGEPGMLCHGHAPVDVWHPECVGGQRAGCPGLGRETGLTTAGRWGECALSSPGTWKDAAWGWS